MTFQKKGGTVTCKELGRYLTPDFRIETLGARRQFSNAFRMLNENDLDFCL